MITMIAMEYTIPRAAEKRLLAKLAARADPEARRMERFLALPDLSRQPTGPLSALVRQGSAMSQFKNFDLIQIPGIGPVDVSFDLFNFAPNHPARSRSDTYYVDEKNILRTHDTVMWYYYLNQPAVQKKIANQEALGVLCYGNVYRKDEIDRRHMNVFHQMGGLYLVPDRQQRLVFDDLKKGLTAITKNLFGPQVNLRFNPDTFPYTNPSLEVEVETDGQWIEILGGGMPRPEVLANFGVRGYNGWAIDPRVTRQLILGQKYWPVSKYPVISRDISFVVPNTFVPNDYFDLIRDLGGDLVEEMALVDRYEDKAKWGAGRISYTYRIIYRSLDRTLTNTEINDLDQKIRERTASEFSAELR